MSPVNVCVYGLWHLGTVTAASLAAMGFQVLGIDEDKDVILNLKRAKAPLYEPGLNQLLKSGLKSKRLNFTNRLSSSLSDANIVWITFDTPVDEFDNANIDYIINRITAIFPFLLDNTPVVISSQLPVGSIKTIEEKFLSASDNRRISFYCIPENVRLGRAIETFCNPDRIVVGARNKTVSPELKTLLSSFSSDIIVVGIESAEMIKHSLNTFLGMSIAFINEIAGICERVGADASEIESALRTDPRIGKDAYVHPGNAFSGGTLGRDISYLRNIATQENLKADLIEGVIASNNYRRSWLFRKCLEILGGSTRSSTVGVLGLAYKPETNSLRRSIAIELIRDLGEKIAHIRAFDPKVTSLPKNLSNVTLVKNMEDVLDGAHLLVIATDWSEFSDLTSESLIKRMEKSIVIDQNGILLSKMANHPQIEYVTLGKG